MNQNIEAKLLIAEMNEKIQRLEKYKKALYDYFDTELEMDDNDLWSRFQSIKKENNE